MVRRAPLQALIIFALAAAAPVGAFAQAQNTQNACRIPTSLACQNVRLNQAISALEAAGPDLRKLRASEQMFVDLLKQPELSRTESDIVRAQVLQRLAQIRFALQAPGSIEAGREALAIWQRHNQPAYRFNLWITEINLANDLAVSKKFDEAETHANQLLAGLGPPSIESDFFRTKALEVLATVLDGRSAPVDERVHRRKEIVELIRKDLVRGGGNGTQQLQLSLALGNLANAQIDANAIQAAILSLEEAEALLRAIPMQESDVEMVLLRSRRLPLLAQTSDRCGAEALALSLLPNAERIGDRILSQILMQSGENYRYFGTTSKAAPLWTRATGLELDMACPNRAKSGAAGCTGSPVLIDHLRGVGMQLRYEGQGRPSAGYRSLVQAGDFLRTRTLSGFATNRDASRFYASGRDIFREQITTAWAINDPTAVPKTQDAAWTCVSR